MNLRLRILPAIPPTDGREIELQATTEFIQWRYLNTGTAPDDEWQDLIAVADLVGPVGPAVEIQSNGTNIQYRPIGATDWINIISIDDLRGDPGPQGQKGWAPDIVAVADGARVVKQLAGYVGGEGDPPTDNVGLYMAPGGTWTATIGDAIDFRGTPGTGTVTAILDGTGIDIDATDPTQPIVKLVAFTGDSGSGGVLGGVPAPAAGDAAAAKFLGAGGIWAVTPQVAAASRSEVEAGTVSTKYISPATQKYGRGTSKAGANLNGTGTIALRSSLNISGVIDQGLGQYQYGLTAAMTGANYTVNFSTIAGSVTVFVGGFTSDTFSASAYSHRVFDGGTSVYLDALHAMSSVDGVLA